MIQAVSLPLRDRRAAPAMARAAEWVSRRSTVTAQKASRAFDSRPTDRTPN